MRLFRPFDPALPAGRPAGDASTQIAVLDRCKEPGADGEPLYKDVLTGLAQAVADGRMATMPRVIGGRYGLASKEFTPGMVKGIFDELAKDAPKSEFTVGIIDDVTHLSLDWDPDFRPDAAAGVTACVFFGLGSDGTVSANKNSIKIIAEETAQLRPGLLPVRLQEGRRRDHLAPALRPQARSTRTYLVGDDEASFVACHQPTFLTRYDMLDHGQAGRGLPAQLRHPGGPGLERPAAQDAAAQIIDKQLTFYVIDAYGIAADDRHGAAHQHHHADLLLRHLRHPAAGRGHRPHQGAVKKTYGKKGQRLLDRNYAGHRRHPGRAAPGRRSRARSPAPSTARRRSRRRPRSSCARSPPP